MILAVDVQYAENKGIAEGVAFEDWSDPVAVGEYVSEVIVESPYVPGRFYKRAPKKKDPLVAKFKN